MNSADPNCELPSVLELTRARVCMACEFWLDEPDNACMLMRNCDRKRGLLYILWNRPDARCLYWNASGNDLWANAPTTP